MPTSSSLPSGQTVFDPRGTVTATTLTPAPRLETPLPRQSTITPRTASHAWHRPSCSIGSPPRTTWWSPPSVIEGPARRAVCTTRSVWKHAACPPPSSSPRRSPERRRSSAPPWAQANSSRWSLPTRSAPCPTTRSRRAPLKPSRRFSVSWLYDSHEATHAGLPGQGYRLASQA